MRLFTRSRWPVVIGLYDARQCPVCAAMVLGNTGQRAHQAFHDELEMAVEGPRDDGYEDPGGYVIGNGPLPVSVRGGADE